MPEIDNLFTCPNHIGELRITPATCAGLWIRARRSAEDDRIRLAPCMGCEVGAAHAGVPVPAKAAPAAATGRTCTRCGQGGRRLVLGKSLCVSCFNRQREYRAGRNARGGPTRDHMPLFCAVMGAVGVAGGVTPTRVDWVSSRLEAALTIERATGAARFGRVNTAWSAAVPCQAAQRQQAAFMVGARLAPSTA